MVINVHAGHNPDGKTACGAVGLIKESTEARKVKDKVISLLKAQGHTVYDCTCDNGTSKNDVLKKIVAKCNAHTVDIDVSIHFNSGRNDYVGDGSIGGTEVFCVSTTTKAVPFAQRTARAISELGFRLRDDALRDDIKTNSALYFLKNTKAPAMLVECCFVDDKDDVKLYNADAMASAIVKGITGKAVTTAPATKPVAAPVANCYPAYKGTTTSITTALAAVGEKDTSITHRRKIGAANGINNVGTIAGNTEMLNRLKKGVLKKA